MSKNVASDLLNPNYGARPDDPWARLGIAIVKQACLDYHKDCRMFKKLPARPVKKVKGKPPEKMTDHEYHLWLVNQVKSRQFRKKRELEFFYSKTCLLYLGQADFKLVDEIIAKIEEKRDAGLPLYDQREQKNMDDLI